MARSMHPFWTVPPRRLASAATVALLLGMTPLLSGTPAAGAPLPSPCSNDPTARLTTVPSPEAVLGFPLGVGQQRVVTNDEVRTYLGAVDERLRPGRHRRRWRTSVLGQPLPYAVVSNERNVRRPRCTEIAEDIRDLRDPRRISREKAAAHRARTARPSSG